MELSSSKVPDVTIYILCLPCGSFSFFSSSLLISLISAVSDYLPLNVCDQGIAYHFGMALANQLFLKWVKIYKSFVSMNLMARAQTYSEIQADNIVFNCHRWLSPLCHKVGESEHLTSISLKIMAC